MCTPTPPKPETRTFTADNLKHFDYLQAVITRMNSNSFMIKGWTLTLVSALIALSASSKDMTYLYVTAVPILIFWTLDTTYLLQEKKFRALFNLAITKGSTIQPFDMDITQEAVKNVLEAKKTSYISVLGSKTIFWFYFPIICLTFSLSFFVGQKKPGLKEPINVSIRDTIKVNEVKSNFPVSAPADTGKKS